MASKNGKLEIQLKECRHLPKSSEQTESFLIRLTFNGKNIGESSKASERSEDGGSILFDFVASVELPCSSQKDISEIIKSPLVVALCEVLPKDKKSKEEKTVVLCTATLDLYPIIQSKISFEDTVVLYGTDGHLNSDLPEIDVSVKVSGVLSKGIVEDGTLIRLRVDSLYSVPESWVPTEPCAHNFDASVRLPILESEETPVVVTKGVLTKPQEADSQILSTHWKWPNLPSDFGQALMIATSPNEPCALEDEDGALNSKEDVAFRSNAQQQRPRVAWNTEERLWLDKSTSKELCDNLAACPVVPVEVMRISLPSQTGKAKGKEEEVNHSFHGIAYVDLSALLFPGVRMIRGAYPIEIFNEVDFTSKTCCKSSHFAGLVSKSSLAMLSKSKGGKRTGSTLKVSTTDLPASDGTQMGGNAPDNSESQEYVAARSYIVIELHFSKPLIPKRSEAVLAQRIIEYIPPRHMPPKRPGGVDGALLNYKASVASIVKQLLIHFRKMNSEKLEGADSNLKSQFLYSLNSSGKYYAFKEDLKRTIVKLVREKYISESKKFQDYTSLQTFIAELYAYLIEEMRNGTDAVLALENPPPEAPSYTTNDLLKMFADEAAIYQDFNQADLFHRQRLVEDDSLAAHWYDYAVHNFWCNNSEKAEQCLKQALGLDYCHVPSLLLYGICCALDGRLEEGERVLEMATTKDPESVVSWVISGLFYEIAGKPMNQNQCLKMATSFGEYQQQKTVILPKRLKGKEPSFVSSAITNRSALLQKGSDEKDISSTSTATTKQDVSQTVVNEDSVPVNVEAQTSITSSDQLVTNLPQGESVKMDAAELSSVKEAGSSTHNLLQSSKELLPLNTAPTKSVFLITADYLLDINALKFAEMALAHECGTSTCSPSSSFIISKAKYLLNLKEYVKAEETLMELTKKDIQNPTVWSTLGHVYYLSEKYQQAQKCYERALSLVTDCDDIRCVYLRLGDIYLKYNEYDNAKRTFLMAVKLSPSAFTWRGVGIACYKLNELENALDALSESNMLNNTDPIVWAYLTLVCVKTHRVAEAEHAFKFMKLSNLMDDDLNQEVEEAFMKIS